MKHVKELLKKYIEADNQIPEERDTFVTYMELIAELQEAIEQDEKENGWIPVSERLPERDWCLAVFRELDTGYQLIPRVAEFINRPDDEHATSDGWHIIDFFEGPKEYIKLLKCVAWMPLPEPYKED